MRERREAEAERRGYQRALDLLQDGNSYLNWLHAAAGPTQRWADIDAMAPMQRIHLYLEEHRDRPAD